MSTLLSQWLSHNVGPIRLLLQLERGSKSGEQLYDQTHLKRLLWYLLGGARGGTNRSQIIKSLQERPLNAHQLAEVLGVDYKTILHHLKILKENGLIVSSSNEGTYGAVLFLSPKMEAALPILDEIWSKIGRKNISPRSKE